MRKHLGKMIADTLLADDRVWLLTGDLGFGILDEARKVCPERAVNVGASEQLMIGAAVGLANEGKIPLCYSITPFIIFRPFELIRIYVNYEKSPIKLIGTGRDMDYGNQGFSHWATDDMEAMNIFKNIKSYRPEDKAELVSIWSDFIYNEMPSYLNVRR